MTDFHFLRPWWLLAFLPLAALLWFLRRHGRGNGDWREICDADLLPHILIGTVTPTARRATGLLALAGALALLALAGPAWERLPLPVFRNLSALVIVLDLSTAMDAADLKPSRLERARYRIADLLRARKDGQTALVVYAGDAFTVTPLTDDVGTITAQLSALSTGLMPAQGVRPDLGLIRAGELLRQSGLKSGDILLAGSGEGVAGAMETAAGLHGEGYRVSVLGVGTAEGAPISLPQGGFLKDERGDILLPKLDMPALQAIASAGGGRYDGLEAADPAAYLAYLERRTAVEAPGGSGETLRLELWEDRGVWLLPLLLPLAALAFRRGWLLAACLLLSVPMPKAAHALDWEELWQTPDQRGRQALEAGQAEEAARRFADPAWKAAAAYQAGKFEDAAKSLQPLDTPDNRYNLGNALARQGKYQEALAAYQRALELEPKHEDARHNKEQVEKALEQQKQQSGDSQDQDQPPGNQQKQDPRQDKNASDSQQRDGQESSPQDPSQADRKSGENDGKKAESPPQKGQDDKTPEPQPGKQEDAASGEKPADEKREPARQAQEATQARQEERAEEGKEHAAAEAEAKAGQEIRQAEEQWLRRIPDDPGGLLKRKFVYQYRQRQQNQEWRQ